MRAGVSSSTPAGAEAIKVGFSAWQALQRASMMGCTTARVGAAALLAVRAGFSPLLTQRLREPSSKFTLRVFATGS